MAASSRSKERYLGLVGWTKIFGVFHIFKVGERESESKTKELAKGLVESGNLEPNTSSFEFFFTCSSFWFVLYSIISFLS